LLLRIRSFIAVWFSLPPSGSAPPVPSPNSLRFSLPLPFLQESRSEAPVYLSPPPPLFCEIRLYSLYLCFSLSREMSVVSVEVLFRSSLLQDGCFRIDLLFFFFLFARGFFTKV